MIAYLLCVLADASVPSGSAEPAAPTPQLIAQPRGEASTYRLLVIRASGAPANLLGIVDIRLTVRALLQDLEPTLVKTAAIDVPADGTASVEVEEADTINLIEKKDYVYDVQLRDGDGNRWQVIPASTFRVMPIAGEPA